MMLTARTMSIAVGVGLLATATAYGAGRLQGNAKVDDAERRAATALSASSEAVRAERAALERERERSSTLETRRRLHLAIVALDERNFGTAQEHLDTAAKGLRGAQTVPAVQKLGDELMATKLLANDDVGEQRSKLLALCKRIDMLVPTAKN